jgi:hypothetical protein
VNLTHQFRRTTTVVAGAVIGLAAAMALTVPASAHTGELTAASACTDTRWKATWTLTTSDTDGHEGTLSNVKVDVDYTQVPPGIGGSPKLAKLTDGATVTADTTVTDTLTLSRVATSATLSLTLTWQVGDATHTKTLRAQATAPADCAWPPPDEPSRLSTTFDCATMTIKLANPQSAKDEVALRLKTSKGEERTLVAGPGETKSETFSASPGFTVEVTQDGAPIPPGGKPGTIDYEQPESCSADDGGEAAGDGSAGGGAAGGSEGGGLPVTGAAAGTVAGAAAALLAIGVALFAMARRRKVRFTA